VAKRDIKRNTLLVASKALAISYERECIVGGCLSLNVLTQRMNKPSQSQNVVNMIYQMQNDPFLSKDVYKLYAGPNMNRQEKISEFLIDPARIEAILSFNSFSSDFGSNAEISTRPVDRSENDNSGIWLVPSYFNHSCVSNTHRVFYSDLMMIYSSKFFTSVLTIKKNRGNRIVFG
jgi:hypothetical protein